MLGLSLCRCVHLTRRTTPASSLALTIFHVTDARVDLREVGELNRRVRVGEAAALFHRVIETCSPEELATLDAELEVALQGVLPKRRRSLAAALEERRNAAPPTSSHAQPSGGASVAEDQEGTNASPAGHMHDQVLAQPAGLLDESDGACVPAIGTETDEDWGAFATEIADLNRRAQPSVAEERVLVVLADMDPAQVRLREVESRSLLGDFFPKRRRRLLNALDDALAVPSEVSQVALGERPSTPGERSDAVPVGESALWPAQDAVLAPIRSGETSASGTQETAPDLSYMANRLHADLEDLSEHHIFQWATFYRDVLAQHFQDFLEEMVVGGHEKALLKIARSAFSRHAREVFEKGYLYTTNQSGNDTHYAITKSLSGLQRFLDLPLEFYSAGLSASSSTGTASQLRRLCSAMTLGIVGGYASAVFDQPGSAILPRFSRSWAHILPLLTVIDLRELISVIEPGVFSDGVSDSLIPLASAIDSLTHARPELAPLPALAQFHQRNRRIDLSLHLPPTVSDSRLLEVHCYLSADYVERHDLEEAAARAVALVVTPLKSDLRALVSSVDRFNDIVVAIGGPGREHDSSRIQAVLEESVWASRSEAGSIRPITFNYASDFPVDNPFLTKYNHVYRSSVRRLMQSYERRNGVRLWCSVRRSGKTTACSSDLGATSGHSTVIAQTCDSTGQMPDGDMFYRRVRQALRSGEEIEDDFVMQAITECAPQRSLRDGRILFVLDEYETLFGRLRQTLKADPGKRYSIVQPLLNQFVAFTQENLRRLEGNVRTVMPRSRIGPGPEPGNGSGSRPLRLGDSAGHMASR